MVSEFTLQDCLVRISYQPCWDCKKAYGGCAWSARFEPVAGWDAEERVLHHNSSTNTMTYAIRACPEFEAEAAR